MIEKVGAGKYSDTDDYQTKLAIEVLLNVEVIMTTGDTRRYRFRADQRGRNANFMALTTGRTIHLAGWRCCTEDFCFAAVTCEYNGRHEATDFSIVDRYLGERSKPSRDGASGTRTQS